MKHRIDPKIDCVFKAVLGSEKNKNLLVNFLNAILGKELEQPIVSVEILNPYNEKEFLDDKLSIVDVKARDSAEKLFQVEIQLCNHPDLPARIVYNWADIFSQQLESGEDYDKLQPTYSIWLLVENLIKDDKRYMHNFKLRDKFKRFLMEHGGIWLLELDKFNTKTVRFDEQRWLRFFKEGETLDDEALPKWMCTDEMRQAMSTLRGFSEKQRAYFKYQARQEYLREQRAFQSWAERSAKALEDFKREAKLREEEMKLREQEAKQKAEEARQHEQEAKQNAEEAKQNAEEAKQNAEEAKQSAEEAKQNAEEARQRELDALEEIERLKAMLKEAKH